MNGSKTVKDRLNLFDKIEKIIFNSEWSKKRFLSKIPKIYHNSKKLLVIYQSTNKSNVNIKKKRNLLLLLEN